MGIFSNINKKSKQKVSTTVVQGTEIKGVVAVVSSMFTKFFTRDESKQQLKPKNSTTVIGEGTEIRGLIESAGSVFCEGKFEGVIYADSLSIGKNGEVLGEVTARTLNVNGLLDGLADVDEVNILESGKILGNMQYKKFEIEKNGIFEGEGKNKNSTSVSLYQKSDKNITQETIKFR